MLILTRRPGESLQIGDEIKVTVLGIKANQVRIGVEAPINVAVMRQELFSRPEYQDQAPQHQPQGIDPVEPVTKPVVTTITVKRKRA